MKIKAYPCLLLSLLIALTVFGDALTDQSEALFPQEVQSADLNKPNDTLQIDAVTMDPLQEVTSLPDTALASLWLTRANGLVDSLLFPEALVYAKKAENVFSHYLDGTNLRLADAWHTLSVVLLKEHHRDSSEIYCRKALELVKKLAGEVTLRTAALLQTLGDIYSFRRTQFDQAMDYYEQSLAIRRQQSSRRIHDLKAESQRQMGTLHFRFGKIQKAHDYYQSALMEASKSDPLDTLIIADYYHKVGVTCHYLDDFESAVLYTRKAIDLRAKILGVSDPLVADGYHNLGTMYQENGLYHEALELHQHTLNIRNQVFGPDYIKNAGTYHNMGNIYYQALEQYDRALFYINQEKRIFVDFHHEQVGALISTHLSLGDIYAYKKAYVTAFQYYQMALNAHLDIFEPEHPFTPEIHRRIGKLYFKQGLYEQALAQYSTAQELRANSDPPAKGRPYFIATDRGETYLAQNKLHQAKQLFQSTIDSILTNHGEEQHLPHLLLADNFLFLSKVFQKQRDFLKAYESIEMAQKFLRFEPPFSFDGAVQSNRLIESTREKANLELRMYYDTDSIQFLYEAKQTSSYALQAVEYVRNAFQTPADKNTLVDFAFDAFQTALQINYTLYEVTDSFLYVETAFEMMEKSKGYLLRNTLNEKALARVLGLPDGLLEKEQLYKHKIKRVNEKRYTSLEKNQDKGKRDSITQASDSLIAAHYIILDSINNLYQTQFPDYYSYQYKNRVISLTGARDSLLKKEQAMLSYFVGDSIIFGLVLKKDNAHLVRITKDFPLEKWVDQIRNDIFNSASASRKKEEDEANNSFVTTASNLYTKIFEPLAPLLVGIPELYIIPDGALSYLPFEVLLTKRDLLTATYQEYPYLLIDHSISYDYSATLLEEMKFRKFDQRPSKLFAGFAPSFTVDSSSLVQGQFDRNRREGPLEWNRHEVVMIRDIIGRGDLFLDSTATKNWFMEVADKYRILHLATHANAVKNGDFSYLSFFESPFDSLENGKVRNWELYQLSLKLDMVVLSACQTGLGEIQRGEGIISLARGFSLAGAKSILTTLWNTSDKASMMLMQNFYENLNEGMSKHQALRKAKLEYLRYSKRPEPHFWAAFIAIGDMSPIAFQSKWSAWYWVLPLSLTLLFILGRAIWRK